MKSKHILFITEKHPDANPALGLSNHYHNLFATFKQSGLGTYEVLHYDTMDKSWFETSLYRILNSKDVEPPGVDLIVLSYLGTHPSNPDDKLLKKLNTKVPIVVIWPD